MARRGRRAGSKGEEQKALRRLLLLVPWSGGRQLFTKEMIIQMSTLTFESCHQELVSSPARFPVLDCFTVHIHTNHAVVAYHGLWGCVRFAWMGPSLSGQWSLGGGLCQVEIMIRSVFWSDRYIGGRRFGDIRRLKPCLGVCSEACVTHDLTCPEEWPRPDA